MDKDTQQKSFAILCLVFLVFVYISSVWIPYFSGQQPQRPAAGQGESSASQSAQLGAIPAPGTSAASQGPYSDAPIEPKYADSSAGTLAKSPSHGGFPTEKEISDAGVIGINTKSFAVKLSLLGGRLTEVRLSDYSDSIEDGSPRLNLVSHTEYAPYPLGVYNSSVNDSRVLYRLKNQQAKGGKYGVKAKKTAFELEGQLADGRFISKTLTFYPDGYFIDVDLKLSAPSPDRAPVEIEWAEYVPEDKLEVANPYNASGYVWFDGERKTHREIFKKISEERHSFDRIRWAAANDKYFMSAMISPDSLVTGWAFRNGNLARSRLVGGERNSKISLYLGPKSYRLLKELDEKLGFELHRAIDLGKTGVISAPLILLLHMFYNFFGNYGIAIVALTILVKFLVYPLSSASFKQMKAMQEVAPELKRIRETVKDKHQQQMDTMALYKKRGVNPMGGCLPMIPQMFIFIGLYSALMLAIELRHAEFAFWIKDLSAPEKCMIGGFGIPVLVILFVISMLVQQLTTPSTMDPTQKKIMMVMPIVMGFMFMRFPAGLALYWLTNNLISIGQQRAMMSGGNKSALAVTAAIAVGMLLLAYVLTLVG